MEWGWLYRSRSPTSHDRPDRCHQTHPLVIILGIVYSLFDRYIFVLYCHDLIPWAYSPAAGHQTEGKHWGVDLFSSLRAS